MIFSRTQVSLTKAEFTALLAHASTDETRPNRFGVYFDAPRMRGVATDACRLAICEGEGDKGEWTYLVPRDAAMVALKAKGAETFVITPANGDIAAMDKANRKVGTFPAPQAHGAEFPPYEHVATAAPSSHVRQAFNTKYLGDLRYVTDAALQSSQWQSITCYPAEDELSPAQFRVKNWTVYLMPARIGNDPQDKALTSAHKVRGKKAPQPAQDAPSTAIVLVGNPKVVDALPVDSKAIQATRAVAASYDLDLVTGNGAPGASALAIARQHMGGMTIQVSDLPPKTPLETWREAHVSILSENERNKPHVKAWLADARAQRPVMRAECAPWG